MTWKSDYNAASRRAAMMSEEYDCIYKVLIVGDSGVGKTSLLLRYVEDSYTENYDFTIGVDFKTKILNIGERKVKMHIWDTSGQDRFRSITASYYRNAQAVLLVYDVTNPHSFENIKVWLNEAETNTDESIAKLLIGNKSDLTKKREIGSQQGREYSKELGIEFMETSTKDSVNIDKVFLTLVGEIEKKYPIQIKDNNNDRRTKGGENSKKSINIQKQHRKKSDCC